MLGKMLSRVGEIALFGKMLINRRNERLMMFGKKLTIRGTRMSSGEVLIDRRNRRFMMFGKMLTIRGTRMSSGEVLIDRRNRRFMMFGKMVINRGTRMLSSDLKHRERYGFGARPNSIQNQRGRYRIETRLISIQETKIDETIWQENSLVLCRMSFTNSRNVIRATRKCVRFATKYSRAIYQREVIITRNIAQRACRRFNVLEDAKYSKFL